MFHEVCCCLTQAKLSATENQCFLGILTVSCLAFSIAIEERRKIIWWQWFAMKGVLGHAPLSLLPCMCWYRCSAKYSRGTLCRSLEFSLCISLTSPVLCSGSSRCLLPAVFPEPMRWLSSLLLARRPTLKDVSWAVGLILFASYLSGATVLYFLMDIVSCKPLFHICCPFIGCFRWESKSNSSFSILVKAEILEEGHRSASPFLYLWTLLV